MRPGGRELLVVEREPGWLLALAASAVGWLVGVGYGLARWHWRTVLVLAGGWAVLAAGYGGLLLGLAVIAVAGLAGLRVASPVTFERQVTVRARSRWRGWRTYRRGWASVIAAHGLVVTRGQASPLVPRLGRPSCQRSVDRLPVRLVPGQTPGDFADAADGLAHAFGARSCRVITTAPGRIVLVLRHADPLAATVPALPPPLGSSLAAVRVGLAEEGGWWSLPLLGQHILIAGVPGAGKGSVLWSLLRGISPDIHAGRVEVWAVDLKGGMELALGAPLFTRFAAGSITEAADLLDDAVQVLDARARRLRGITRLHEPTVSDPLLLLVLDELASLTAYVSDRALKTRLATALALLQSKGRAVGVLVVAAVQDPRKETVPLRDLFTVRVALRLPDGELVDLVLGHGAHARGAAADTIALSTPGVGYVVVDGQPEPLRVRAGHVTDTDLHAMAAHYPAPGSRLAPDGDTAGLAGSSDVPDGPARAGDSP